VSGIKNATLAVELLSPAAELVLALSCDPHAEASRAKLPIPIHATFR
jgi:hypothetical protein